jgi:hypothetical protein
MPYTIVPFGYSALRESIDSKDMPSISENLMEHIVSSHIHLRFWQRSIKNNDNEAGSPNITYKSTLQAIDY